MLGTELAVAFLETVAHHRDADGGSLQFDTTALSALRDVTATPGRCTAVLPVTPPVSNRYGTLHGGCIATIVDTVGSAALITLSPKGGVSLNINVNYLSKMPVGGNVLIEAQVVKLGRTIATIDVQLREEGSNTLVAQGTHIKFIAENKPTMEQIIEQQAKEAQQQGQRQQGQQHQATLLGIRSKL